MVLTNLGVAVGNNVQYKRKLKDWNCTNRRKSKISKSVEMWFNAIGSTTSHEDAVITSFHSWYEKAAWPFFYLLAYRPAAKLFPLISLPFPYASLSFHSCLAKIIMNSLPYFRGREYSKTIPAWLAYKLCRLQTQPFSSPFFTKWFYWLSLKRLPSWKFKYK